MTNRRANLVLAALAVLACVGTSQVKLLRAEEKSANLGVTTNFPNGSGAVEAIDQKHRIIRIKPSAHPDRGWDCWWYFKVSGIQPGETITIDLGGSNIALADQATFSTDQRTWRHTAAGHREANRITYQQQIDAREAWFAWGPPLTDQDATSLCRWAAEKCPQAEAFELCRSRANRPVMALRISPTQTQRPFGIWITARQHAWESGGSWVARGLIEWLVSDDPRAVALRQKAVINIVPVMDVDNVAIGAGGKEEVPQDHNRDWTDRPHHPAVAAVQREILRMNAAGKFDLFIDLHNPGHIDKNSMLFISPRAILSNDGWNNLQSFLQVGQLEMTGPLPYRGQTRESGPGYDARWQQIGKNWVTQHTADHVVSVTLETVWNTPQSTTEGYLTMGRQLGLAIERYFRDATRKAVAE